MYGVVMYSDINCIPASTMATPLTHDLINELEELMDAFDLLDEYDIDADGVDDLSEAQTRLRQYLQRASGQVDQQAIVVSFVIYISWYIIIILTPFLYQIELKYIY